MYGLRVFPSDQGVSRLFTSEKYSRIKPERRGYRQKAHGTRGFLSDGDIVKRRMEHEVPERRGYRKSRL
jgi:hypothetical protein